MVCRRTVDDYHSTIVWLAVGSRRRRPCRRYARSTIRSKNWAFLGTDGSPGDGGGGRPSFLRTARNDSLTIFDKGVCQWFTNFRRIYYQGGWYAQNTHECTVWSRSAGATLVGNNSCAVTARRPELTCLKIEENATRIQFYFTKSNC